MAETGEGIRQLAADAQTKIDDFGIDLKNLPTFKTESFYAQVLGVEAAAIQDQEKLVKAFRKRLKAYFYDPYASLSKSHPDLWKDLNSISALIFEANIYFEQKLSGKVHSQSRLHQQEVAWDIRPPHTTRTHSLRESKGKTPQNLPRTRQGGVNWEEVMNLYENGELSAMEIMEIYREHQAAAWSNRAPRGRAWIGGGSIDEADYVTTESLAETQIGQEITRKKRTVGEVIIMLLAFGCPGSVICGFIYLALSK